MSRQTGPRLVSKYRSGRLDPHLTYQTKNVTILGVTATVMLLLWAWLNM